MRIFHRETFLYFFLSINSALMNLAELSATLTSMLMSGRSACTSGCFHPFQTIVENQLNVRDEMDDAADSVVNPSGSTLVLGIHCRMVPSPSSAHLSAINMFTQPKSALKRFSKAVFSCGMVTSRRSGQNAERMCEV